MTSRHAAPPASPSAPPPPPPSPPSRAPPVPSLLPSSTPAPPVSWLLPSHVPVSRLPSSAPVAPRLRLRSPLVSLPPSVARRGLLLLRPSTSTGAGRQARRDGRAPGVSTSPTARGRARYESYLEAGHARGRDGTPTPEPP